MIFQEDQIDQVLAFLNAGEPVGMPTETVYGLAAPIFDPIAVQKIFTLKRRPQDNPLIAHVSSFQMVEAIAQDIPDSFYQLANVFWPGPLALVLPKKDSVPDIVSGGHSTIAIRMPSHPLALKMIELAGCPLVAPSANISGRPSPTCATHVEADFGLGLSAILDGGSCQIGIESTVLSLVSEVPVLMRPGSITKSQIEQVLGCKVSLPVQGGPVLSPGMKYRHYAPKANIHVVTQLPELTKDSFVLSIHGPRQLNGKDFYAHLREADQLGIKDIWVLLDPVSMEDDALMNRLLKASGDISIIGL